MVSSMHVEPVSRSDQYKRVMKPLLERKRRARINRCLDELRDLLVSVLQAEGEAVTRLEKADILELTVRHVRKLSQRRRLALPTPTVKHQQEREDVARFQQGFVAAAQQVQTFLMSTNSLEPAVSTRLLSHLTNYATSIAPAPSPTANPRSPASSPVNQQSPVSCPQIPNRPQMHPPAPPPPAQPTLVTKKISSTSPVQFSTQRNQASQLQSNQHTLSTEESNSRPSFPSSTRIPAQQPVLPLIDLSNRQLSSNNFNGTIVRDVKPQDRLVAPSPFIDVVSTENDHLPQIRCTPTVKIEEPYNRLASSPSSSDDEASYKIQLQAKVVASISPSHDYQRNLQMEMKHHIFALSASDRNSSPSQRISSPIPEDLSMKKYCQESSWRPW